MSKKKRINKTVGKNSEFDRPVTAEEAKFADLQKIWYAKLAKSGFDDVEWVDHKTGYGHDAPFRKKSLSYLRSKYDPSVEEHYRQCRIFLEHNAWGPDEKVQKRLMAWHTEGISMRDIVKLIAGQVKRYPGSIFKKAYSLYWVHIHLNEVLDYMEFWQYLDENGVHYQDGLDFYIDDIPIRPNNQGQE